MRPTLPRAAAPDPDRRRPPDPWWRRPVSPDTWRQQLAIVLTVPAALITLALAVVGRHRAAAGLQRHVVAAAPGHGDDHARAGNAGWTRVVLHALVSLPIGLVGLLVTGYTWLLVVMNLAYPLRPGLEYTDAWGGPSLAGAWTVHAAAGLAFLFLAPWIVRGFLTAQCRLTARLLGPGSPGDRTPARS